MRAGGEEGWRKPQPYHVVQYDQIMLDDPGVHYPCTEPIHRLDVLSLLSSCQIGAVSWPGQHTSALDTSEDVREAKCRNVGGKKTSLPSLSRPAFCGEKVEVDMTHLRTLTSRYSKKHDAFTASAHPSAANSASCYVVDLLAIRSLRLHIHLQQHSEPFKKAARSRERRERRGKTMISRSG